MALYRFKYLNLRPQVFWWQRLNSGLRVRLRAGQKTPGVVQRRALALILGSEGGLGSVSGCPSLPSGSPLPLLMTIRVEQAGSLANTQHFPCRRTWKRSRPENQNRPCPVRSPCDSAGFWLLVFTMGSRVRKWPEPIPDHEWSNIQTGLAGGLTNTNSHEYRDPSTIATKTMLKTRDRASFSQNACGYW